MIKNPATGTRCIATYSIVGRDPETGEIGVAVQSKFPCVGSAVPWVRASTGAVATQAWANTSFGPRGLELLDEGKSPEEVKEILISEDEGFMHRQFGIVDTQGRTATFTGDECLYWAGGIAGENFACQGNILKGEKTVEAMAEAFSTVEGDLAERLTMALMAAQEAGGDARGMQAAALYIAKEGGGYGGYNDRFIDIRVDENPDPIVELRRILKVVRILFYRTKEGNLVDLTGEHQEYMLGILRDGGYYDGPDGPWDEAMQKALDLFYSTENFEERMAEFGKIDIEVIDYLKSPDVTYVKLKR
ncbi:MAG: DUF1028 domain-containing protein [Actinomycetia bacterium]|nr:DUF1028 domain-containing protein [Actinomycetes bacterium]